MKHRAVLAVGFLLGAAVLVGGQGNDEDLELRLWELREQAARLQGANAHRGGAVPPVTDRGFRFAMFHITDLLYGVRDFIPPSRADGPDDAPMFGGQVEIAPQPFGTVEEVGELVRVRVQPEAWNTVGASLQPLGAALLAMNRRDVLRDVQRFLDEELRPLASRTVSLDVLLLEIPGPQAAALAAKAGTDLDPEELSGLAAGARRLFAGRALALPRQRVVLWHGAQAAAVTDHDVEVAQESKTADPVVRVEMRGGIVGIRATPDAAAERGRIERTMDHETADERMRTVKTEASGEVQAPARRAFHAAADLIVGSGRWAVAAEATGAPGARRFLLVRPTVLLRPGGAR